MSSAIVFPNGLSVHKLEEVLKALNEHLKEVNEKLKEDHIGYFEVMECYEKGIRYTCSGKILETRFYCEDNRLQLGHKLSHSPVYPELDCEIIDNLFLKFKESGVCVEYEIF